MFNVMLFVNIGVCTVKVQGEPRLTLTTHSNFEAKLAWQNSNYLLKRLLRHLLNVLLSILNVFWTAQKL